MLNEKLSLSQNAANGSSLFITIRSHFWVLLFCIEQSFWFHDMKE